VSKWSDRITLISVLAPGEETDSQGFYLPPEETRREVYGNKRSVGSAEFYRSSQAGTVAQIKFIVRSDEYSGEKFVEYEGKRYRVLRTYETTSLGSSRTQNSASGEFTELTLTDLSERGTPPGAALEPDTSADMEGNDG
jgi:hypothetical protein